MDEITRRTIRSLFSTEEGVNYMAHVVRSAGVLNAQVVHGEDDKTKAVFEQGVRFLALTMLEEINEEIRDFAKRVMTKAVEV